MKIIISIALILSTLLGFTQKKYIPDLLAESEKVPVVVDFPYPAAFKQTRSGAYLFNADLQIPAERRHVDVDRTLLKNDAIEISNKVVESLNQVFQTDKFYYLPLEEVKSDASYQWAENNIGFFVSYMLNINYEYSNTVKPKYSVDKRSSITFYYTSENRARPAVGFNYFLDTGPITHFDVEEQESLQFPPAQEFMDPNNQANPSIEDVITYHPHDQYLLGVKEGVDEGVDKAYEKIMKKYNKKKKKKK